MQVLIFVLCSVLSRVRSWLCITVLRLLLAEKS